jgi:glutaminyl-peptide cyclotransferase
LILKFKFITAALLLPVSIAAAGTPEYAYRVVHVYPHDTSAFTEGLFYLNGFLYESTGEEGRSSVRKIRLETGEVIEKHQLAPSYFGEGIVNWRDHILQLTWMNETGFVYDLKTLSEQKQFHYPGEGWALTQDGKRIIMDDGSAQIRFWDPDTLKEIARITVTDQGEPVKNLNELEWVKGEIFANVWHTDRIARIDPVSGKVMGWIDLSGLWRPEDRDGDPESVLNGIAYDSKRDRLFVTGKRWPKLFEIRVIPYRMSVK